MHSTGAAGSGVAGFGGAGAGAAVEAAADPSDNPLEDRVGGFRRLHANFFESALSTTTSSSRASSSLRTSWIVAVTSAGDKANGAIVSTSASASDSDTSLKPGVPRSAVSKVADACKRGASCCIAVSPPLMAIATARWCWQADDEEGSCFGVCGPTPRSFLEAEMAASKGA